MKICRSCGNECQDIDVFCSKCGAKLGTEIKCANCGKVLAEDDKFCPACGTKVGEPMTTTKVEEPKKVDSVATINAAELIKKILFFAVGGALLFLLSLMFVGCFGDIARSDVFSNDSLGYSSASATNIKYFFGDAFKQILNSTENQENEAYRGFLIVALIFEYIAWLTAIAAVVVGIVLGTISLVKGKRNNYELKIKMFMLTLLGTLPYLFIVATKYFTNISYSSTYSNYIHYDGTIGQYTELYRLSTFYGWGTMMILISAILGVFLIAGYKVLRTVFEKKGAKNIVRVSIVSGLALVLFITLAVATGPSIACHSQDSSRVYDGVLSMYRLFTDSLRDFSNGSGEVHWYEYAALTGIIFVYLGAILLLLTICKMFSNKKNRAFVITYGATGVVAILAGCITCVVACEQSVKSSSESYVFFVAPGAICVVVFAILAIVAYCVTYNFDTKKPNQIAQQ